MLISNKFVSLEEEMLKSFLDVVAYIRSSTINREEYEYVCTILSNKVKSRKSLLSFLGLRELRKLFESKRKKDIFYQNINCVENEVNISFSNLFVFLTARLKSSLFNDNGVSIYA